MRFTEIVQTSRRVAEEPSRLKKIDALASCLRRLAQDEIEAGIAFLSGELTQGRIGIGYASIRGAVPAGAHASPRNEIPGGGRAADGRPTPVLSVREVDEVFGRIARMSGPGSQMDRIHALRRLMELATREEQGFLARLVTGELRQGAQEGVMIEAIAGAARVKRSSVRRAWMLCGEIGRVAKAALTGGEEGLGSIRLQLLHPLMPMLAQTADEVEDVISGLGRAAFEYKFDGARVQVHRAGDDVKVFTRNLNDVTPRVPELIETVRALPVSRILLDGEAIALRPGGKPEPFQVTMRRFGRRLNIDTMRKSLPLSFFFFDCLHFDGEDLMDHPTEERFATLKDVVPEGRIVPRIVTASREEACAFLERAVDAGHEGVMAKSLDAPYEAGRRGGSWLKLKPYHTLDLVVLAAEWGSGRRRGWLSNIHLGARDPKGGFVMLGKTFKGMTDEMLEWQTRRFLELETGRDAYTVHVRPELVVEVSFDGLQESPHYRGGLSLRFARVKRYRPDKRVDETDTIDTVREIYGRQFSG